MSETTDLRQFRVPAWCPFCQCPMKGLKSTTSYYNFGVCNVCFIGYIDGREQRWKDGWRPSPEEVAAWTAQIS